MKIPEEQNYIFEMSKLDAREACEMAYESGYQRGKIDTLKEQINKLNKIKNDK